MARKRSFWKMLCVVMVFGMAVAGCDDGSTDDNGGGDETSNPFTGDCTGTATYSSFSGAATVSITSSTWNFVFPQAGMNASGTYTYSGNTATLKSGSVTVGTATV
jgi:uncharacterized lipoprotein YehR (DUF1307 family)